MNLKDFDTSRVMQVMITLVSVAYRECLAIIETEMLSEKSSHLVHLLCSLQTNLLMWCCCQMESENKCRAELAETVIKNCKKVDNQLLFLVLLFTLIVFRISASVFGLNLALIFSYLLSLCLLFEFKSIFYTFWCFF